MPETIGQRLQNMRIARRLTLEQAAQATRIRLSYLQALEHDDFTAMPSPVQGRGFLRLYAQYLDLDVEAVLAEMRQVAVQESTSVEFIQPEMGEQATHDTVDEPPWGETTSFWTRQLERLKDVRNRALAGSTAPEPGSELIAQTVRQATDEEQIEAKPVPETGAQEDGWEVLKKQTDLPPHKNTFPEKQSLWQRWLAGGRALLERLQARRPIQHNLQEALQQESGLKQSSQEIFAEIGAQLCGRRELLSLTLDEVEQHTRLRSHFLQALEAGRFESLPSPVQTRGMLHNYAVFLDVDAENLLLRFAEGLQAQHRERQPVHPDSPSRTGRFLPFKVFAAGDVIFGVCMAVGLLIFVIWAAGRVLNSRPHAEAKPQAPSISDVLLASPIAGNATLPPTPTLVLEGVAAAQETPTPAAGASANAPLQRGVVQVTVSVLERTWMRVLVDGKIEFEGRVVPGSAYPFTGEQQVEILTGNGAALQVVHNQRDLGRMGNFGEVVDRIYVIDRVLVPTATVSPTPTATLPPTSTPMPSRTPVVTPNTTGE